jgi:hypothetical protein
MTYCIYKLIIRRTFYCDMKIIQIFHEEHVITLFGS